jgi:hypothetical protein
LHELLKNFDNVIGRKKGKGGGKVREEILLEKFGRKSALLAWTEI